MEFKPTLLKSIVSLIIGLFAYLSLYAIINGFTLGVNPQQSLGIALIRGSPLWLGSLILVYVFWSLFQKKKIYK